MRNWVNQIFSLIAGSIKTLLDFNFIVKVSSKFIQVSFPALLKGNWVKLFLRLVGIRNALGYSQHRYSLNKTIAIQHCFASRWFPTPTPRDFGNVWGIFACHNRGSGGISVASSGWRPGMHRCPTTHRIASTTEHSITPNVNSPKV